MAFQGGRYVHANVHVNFDDPREILLDNTVDYVNHTHSLTVAFMFDVCVSFST